MRSFARSEALPSPVGYKTMNKNPILECITDQTRLDPEWSKMNLNGLDLFMEIVTGLRSRKIEWPRLRYDLQISCDQWIDNMEKNLNFRSDSCLVKM